MGARRFVLSRLDPETRFGLRFTLFAVALTLVALPFGGLLDQVLDEGAFTRYDRALAQTLHRVVAENEWVVGPLEVVTFLGDPVFLFAMAGAGFLLLWMRRRYRLAAFLAATGVIGGVMQRAVKAIVARPRPDVTDPFATAFGHSFPSGHAFGATVVFGALLLVFMPLVARRWRTRVVAGYAVLVLVVAFTRLALVVHYVTDVVAGIVLGLAWLAAATAVFSTWRVERGRPPVEPLEGVEPEAAADLAPGDVARRPNPD